MLPSIIFYELSGKFYSFRSIVQKTTTKKNPLHNASQSFHWLNKIDMKLWNVPVLTKRFVKRKTKMNEWIIHNYPMTQNFIYNDSACHSLTKMQRSLKLTRGIKFVVIVLKFEKVFFVSGWVSLSVSVLSRFGCVTNVFASDFFLQQKFMFFAWHQAFYLSI